MKRIKGQHRQGDVLLHPVETIPKGASFVPLQYQTLFVLAEGEATGHIHAFVDDGAVKQLVHGGITYLSVTDKAIFRHGHFSIVNKAKKPDVIDHYDQTVEPGTYRVIIQREKRHSRSVQVLD